MHVSSSFIQLGSNVQLHSLISRQLLRIPDEHQLYVPVHKMSDASRTVFMREALPQVHYCAHWHFQLCPAVMPCLVSQAALAIAAVDVSLGCVVADPTTI